MNIITFGIPSSDFIKQVVQDYGSIEKLYCCESRPFEEEVSVWIAGQAKIAITLITDNMVASLCSEEAIDFIFVFGSIDGDSATVISGTEAMVSIGEHFSVKTVFVETGLPSTKLSGTYFGNSITVDGSSTVESINESLSLNLFDKVLQCTN